MDLTQKISEDKEIKIEIKFSTNGYFLSGIRDLAMNFAKNLSGFNEKWAFRFQTVVDELVSNAIEHGCMEGDEVSLSLISLKNKYFEVIVEDAGHGDSKISAEKLKEVYLEKIRQFGASEYVGIRGRGLAQIVHSWSDEVKFEDIQSGGIRVKVIKYYSE